MRGGGFFHHVEEVKGACCAWIGETYSFRGDSHDRLESRSYKGMAISLWSMFLTLLEEMWLSRSSEVIQGRLQRWTALQNDVPILNAQGRKGSLLQGPFRM